MKKSVSGIRGIVGRDFGPKDVAFFCNNFAALAESGKCVVARDTRPSGEMLKEAACAALMQNGIDVLDLGVSPTPVAYYEARRHGAGLVISASHNPLEWNGLKFIINGRGIDCDELQRVTGKNTTRIKKIGNEKKADTDYVQKAQKLIGRIDVPPKVALDFGGGAASAVAVKLLEGLGCGVRTINSDPASSSRGPDPTADALEGLIACCGRDVGFAFDLDGDRLVIVHNGQKQSPDATLGLGIARALELGYKKFVLSTDTSASIEKFIIKKGGSVKRSKVGEANVVGLMLKTGAQAGGEGSSAGFILPEFNYCRDGILSCGLIASMIGGGLDEAASFMDGYYQAREKVPADSGLHDAILDGLGRKMRQEFGRIDTTDGLKAAIDGDTWMLVRKSNTEDIIRISVESDSVKKKNNILERARRLVDESYEEAR